MVVEEFFQCHTRKMPFVLKTGVSQAKKFSGKWSDEPFPEVGMLFGSKLKITMPFHQVMEIQFSISLMVGRSMFGGFPLLADPEKPCLGKPLWDCLLICPWELKKQHFSYPVKLSDNELCDKGPPFIVKPQIVPVHQPFQYQERLRGNVLEFFKNILCALRITDLTSSKYAHAVRC